MRDESVIEYPEIDDEAFLEILGVLGEGYFMGLAEDDGEPVGMITATMSRYVFAKEVYVIHDVFFVRKDKRGTGTAFRLVQAFEDWARKIGAKRGILGIHTGLNIEITSRFYEKLGYRHIGGSFIKEFS